MVRLLCQSLHYRFIFGGAKIDTVKQVTYFFCKILPAFIASLAWCTLDGERKSIHCPESTCERRTSFNGSIDSWPSEGQSTKYRTHVIHNIFQKNLQIIWHPYLFAQVKCLSPLLWSLIFYYNSPFIYKHSSCITQITMMQT